MSVRSGFRTIRVNEKAGPHGSAFFSFIRDLRDPSPSLEQPFAPSS